MKKHGLLVIAMAVVCSIVIYSCLNDKTTQSSDSKLEKISLLIDWTAEPTYAGFYVAKSKGFFAKAGYDVKIVQGSGAVTAAQLVGAGEYLLASSSGEATAIARSKGVPVQSLAVLYPDVPTVIFSRVENPIRVPNDLVGKRIALIPGSISVDEYRGLLQANGIDRKSITEVGGGTDVAPLFAGQVDGLFAYEEMNPVQLRVSGKEVAMLRFREHGVNAYSLNLITSDEALSKHKPTVEALRRAVLDGYQWAKDHPVEAGAIMHEEFPEKSESYLQASMDVVVSLMGNRPVGEQTRAGWEKTIATLESLQLLNAEVTVDQIVSPEFLSP